MSTAHPWLSEWPWPSTPLPHEQLQERIEHLMAIGNMGVLATQGKTGPIASPIEYRAEGITPYMYPQPGSPKLAAIKRVPLVCFAIYAPLGNWTSCRSAQIFGQAVILEPGTPNWDHALEILPWQASAAELGRDINVKPTHALLKIEPERIVYTEHWLRRDGYAPRHIWRST